MELDTTHPQWATSDDEHQGFLREDTGAPEYRLLDRTHGSLFLKVNQNLFVMQGIQITSDGEYLAPLWRALSQTGFLLLPVLLGSIGLGCFLLFLLLVVVVTVFGCWYCCC
jgi:hypothetical protein